MHAYVHMCLLHCCAPLCSRAGCGCCGGGDDNDEDDDSADDADGIVVFYCTCIHTVPYVRLQDEMGYMV